LHTFLRMNSVLRKLVSLSVVKAVLKVPVAQYSTIPDGSIYSTRFFQHACANPLTSLLMDAELLSLEAATPSQLTEACQRLKTSTEHLRSLFTEFFVQNQNKRFEVYKAVAEVIAFYRTHSQSSVTIISLLPDQLFLQGSEILFKEMLVCLINNALEAYLGEQTRYVIVLLKRVEKKLILEVIDFGIGMNPVALFFARYKGLSYKPKGSGLGVSFCMQVVKNHFGGVLQMRSKPAHGTRVAVLIPTR
jgi:signal transduction histidine kinase